MTQAPATIIDLQVQGMHCASCVGRVESALRSVPGVRSAAVSLADGAARVEGHAVNAAALLDAVKRSGFEAAPALPARSVAEHRTAVERRQHAAAAAWKRRAIIALGAAAPLEFVHFFGSTLGFHAAHDPASLWGWVSFALATAVQAAVGSAFYASAWRAARARSTNMDTLIGLGAGAAYLLSVGVLLLRVLGVRDDLPSYFGESAALLGFISLGHWLEARTTAAAGSAVRELLALQPDTALLLDGPDDPSPRSVPSTDVRPGDFLLCRPGDRVGIDGEVVRGLSAADESHVTGEPLPVEKRPGDAVVAGSLNLTGALVVRATADGRETTVTRIAELVRVAQSSKTRIQRLADRVCAIFVPAVLTVAAATFIGWLFINDPRWPAWMNAAVHATTVLVISCPCALGLATPTAVMAASGAASRRGILVKSAGALERLASARVVMLDKTGTLTRGRPRVVAGSDEALSLAAALGRASTHPLSLAAVEAAAQRGLAVPPAASLAEAAGQGVKGEVGGSRIEVLSPRAAEARGFATPESTDGQTASVVLRDGEALGWLTFSDELKPEAADTVATLRARGLRVVLLTGDRLDSALRVAAECGIPPPDVHAGLSPAEKLEHVRAAGAGVVMVGDGINDAAALAQAGAAGGVGVAIGAGANIAIESADVVLPAARLSAVVDLLDVGRGAMKTIRQNLFFSFVYNVLAIPAAALGMLGRSGPVIASLAMGLSDVCVVGNSLRLRRRLDRQRARRKPTGQTAPRP